MSQQIARGQAHVVGVTLLIGISVIALAGLTAGIGSLVERNAASADATRVADDLAIALAPVEATGHNRGSVDFSDGRFRTVEREVRVLNSSGVRRRVSVGGLVFTAGDHRVEYVSNAIVRSAGESNWLSQTPDVTTSRAGAVFIASIARLNGSDTAVSGASTTGVMLTTNVTHDRTALGPDRYGIAIETARPGPLERWFREQNATVNRREFDGDGVESVVARFAGTREGYVVVHDMRLEVSGG